MIQLLNLIYIKISLNIPKNTSLQVMVRVLHYFEVEKLQNSNITKSKMRKTILKLFFVAAITAVAGWSAIQNEKDVELSGLALDNLEALASCETSVGGSCWWTSTSFTRCCEGGTYGCSPCD